MENTIDELLAIADELGWGLDKETDCWRFSAYSPAGQDFSFTIEIPENSHEMICDLHNDIANYSPFEEAMLWVKNGHGVNGAPDDPADILADMEDCKQMMIDLLNEWEGCKSCMTPRKMQEQVRELQIKAEELVKQIDATIEQETDEDRINAYDIIRERLNNVRIDIEEIGDPEFPDYIF